VPPLIVDAHPDLLWNMRMLGRSYTRPVSETRRLEQDTVVPARNEDATLGWPEYQQGRVAVLFASLSLLDVLRCWETGNDSPPASDRTGTVGCPVGLVLSMENAEGVRSPAELDEWWELGGFGVQSVPAEIDTIADLQKLVSLLLDRGYNEMDVAAVMGGNWLSVLKRILPSAS
jgi:Membrane dipeptidase (Peptidase family M19)